MAMNASIFVLSVVLFAVLCYRNFYRRCTLPGPTWLPIIGTLPKLGSKPYKDFVEISKEYGNIFKYRLGFYDIVVLNSYDVFDDIFRKKKESFSDRVLSFPEDTNQAIGFAEMQFCERYRKLRVAIMGILNSPDIGEQTFEEMLKEEVTSTFKFITDEFRTNPFSPTIPFGRCTINIVFCLLFGHRSNIDKQELDRYIDALHQVQMFGIIPHSFTFYTTFKEFIATIFPNPKLSLSTRRAMEIIWGLSNGEVTLYKQSTEKKKHLSFLGKFLSLGGEETAKLGKTYLSEEALPGVVVNIILGSLESTTILMCWIFIVLAKYRDVQVKLRKEVEDVLGRERSPTLHDRDSMPYAMAVLQEIFRFITPVPLEVPHRSGKDDTYNGCFIPKGTFLIGNIWAIHYNEKLFPEPYMFKPERFINETGEFVKSKYVISFGIGARSCPGEVIAQRELFLFLVHLVQTFDIQPPEGTELPNLPDDGIFGGSGTFPPPFKIRCIPIQSLGRQLL